MYYVFTGMPNLGNTCYLNAALQALVHTKPFAHFFLECSDFVPPRLEGPGSGTHNTRAHTLSLTHTHTPQNKHRDSLSC